MSDNILPMDVLSTAAAAWLEHRGLDMELCVKLGLTSKPAHGTGEEIVIPYLVDGRLVGRKYKKFTAKKGDQDWRFDPGFKGEIFWNQAALEDETLKSQPLVITEGEWDAITAIQCGFIRTVSMPNGAGNLAVLDEQFDKLEGVDKIILATDGDQAGAQLQREMIRRFGKARCIVVKYPKDTKDLNEVLTRYQERGVTETIRRAEYVPVRQLTKITELPEVKERKIFKAAISPLFDKHISICRGQTSVWTGYPGHGKSTLLSQVLVKLAKRYGWRLAVKAFEDDYRLDFRPRFAAQMFGRSPDSITPQQWAEADKFMDEHLFVVDDPEGMTLMTHEYLLDTMEAAVRRHGVEMIVIDPWTMIQDGGQARSEVEQQKNDLGRWVHFARKFDVHLAIVAHPRKQESDDHIPVGRDISGSAHWFNMVDLGVSCWRPDPTSDPDGECKVKVWKVKRQQTMGPLGTFEIGFHAPSHTFQAPFMASGYAQEPAA